MSLEWTEEDDAEEDARPDASLEVLAAVFDWERRIEHLSVCKVKPWWESPPNCECHLEDP